MNAREIQKNQKTDKAINKNNAVGINISLGSTGWKDHVETITEETRGSRITAGRTAAVIAKEDMTVKGSTVNAQDIHLKAGNNIRILSSENKSTTIEDYKAKSGSIGSSISKGAMESASYGKGKGQTEETILTHTPSDITAKDTVSLSSGNDTVIRGGTVKGNKVIANAGRMSIESEQDKKNYKETGKTTGLSISYTPGSAVSVSGGKGQTNTDSAYISVTKQARHLRRTRRIRYPSQEQHPPQRSRHRQPGRKRKNRITTGTLTWENIDNKAEYKSKRKRNLLYQWSRNPLKRLGTPLKHGSHRQRKSRNNHPICHIQRNNNHHRQRKPETGHRETEQGHRKQLKQTQRNLRQNKSRRKTGTHSHDEHSGKPNHP